MPDRKYVLTIGSATPRNPFDYSTSPLPSLYAEIPFDDVVLEEGDLEFFSFCLTGEFSASRSKLEKRIRELGGEVHENVSAALDYLVVGDKPSKGWKFGNYGTKINRALEIRASVKGDADLDVGKPSLVRESNFLSSPQKQTGPAELLDKLIERRLRSVILLSDFSDGYTNGWACCLPKAMQPALDIRQTIRTVNRVETILWTQGRGFAFGVGDVIHDCKEAYFLPWAEALRHMKFSLQVREVVGRVVGFDIFLPNSEQTALIKDKRAYATQIEFVRLLITGSCAGLNPDQAGDPPAEPDVEPQIYDPLAPNTRTVESMDEERPLEDDESA